MKFARQILMNSKRFLRRTQITGDRIPFSHYLPSSKAAYGHAGHEFWALNPRMIPLDRGNE